MTREHFEAQMGRLIVLKGWPDEIEEYFPVLTDIPEPLFALAVTHALRTRAWFPTPAELRVDCDAVHRSAPVEAPAPVVVELLGGGREVEIPNPLGGPPLKVYITRDWRHDCDSCRDTGWVARWCGDGASRHQDVTQTRCGRRKEHASHEWVEPCSCLEWNPTLRRRREATTKYSHAPGKVA
mgnify:CR=1 FL=1